MTLAISLPSKELNLYPIDYPFETLVDKIKKGSLILDPDYQRIYKWNDEKASGLIESCLMQIPLPSCYFAEDENKNHVVIDGVQRLNSVSRFINNEFTLTGLQAFNDLNGKHFRDLELKTRRHIETYTIRCIILRNDNQPVLIRDIFARLNQGAVMLSTQEIRHALYSGSLNNLLKSLSQESEIQELVTGEEKRNNRTSEELVLRFFALNNDLKNYETLKKYLDDYMMNNRNLREEQISEMRESFLQALQKCRNVFTKYIFADPDKKRLRRSIAHYDLQMYSLQSLPNEFIESNRDKIVIAYQKLCSKNDFQKTLSGGVTQKQSILKRRELWLGMLKEIS